MVDILTCIFIGIMTFFVVIDRVCSTYLKIKKRRIWKCGYCKKKIYFRWSKEAVNSSCGFAYYHRKCLKKKEKE